MISADKLAVSWFRGMGIAGLVFSLVFFILYVVGIVPSAVSPGESAVLWNGSSESYLAETGLVFISGWFRDIGNGYVLSAAALAFLASTALPVLISLGILWFIRKDFLYGIMAIMISCVLVFAIIG